MSDIVVDSSVIAKWVLPENDSPRAQQMLEAAVTRGDRLLALDLALCEVANAIWKRVHQRLIPIAQARRLLTVLLDAPIEIEPATPLLGPALELAAKYDRSVYDALFVALANSLGLDGVTADEPLCHAISNDFPRISLLRDWPFK